MPEASEFEDLSQFHEQGDDPVPSVVLAVDASPELVWRNELGGLTYRVGDRYVKWSPRSAGIDLARERDRLLWLDGRHPAPRVLSYGADGEAEWLVTAGMPGDHAVGDEWRARRSEAIAAIARGLRAIHAVPVDDEARGWESWVVRRPPSLGDRPATDEPVLVHGDACAPNTLISASGEWVGNVDFGDLAVGDRWADLAVASMSLDWNFGDGHQDEFFAAYGIARDEERIQYYRALWELES
ncbi:aminoglycoside 3'-phosphotransferase [Microbacterium aoyamense]|uniref:Aminoglycoside 3'-phosphotransferase n=1 Tax=Microbacterium aoyamense TaxID=344166 RepID=A0ABN2PSP5_9MICO|nr:aminoglycoside 3'-phosphotransferase [Microbacterium aoyamense]